MVTDAMAMAAMSAVAFLVFGMLHCTWRRTGFSSSASQFQLSSASFGVGAEAGNASAVGPAHMSARTQANNTETKKRGR